MQALTTSPARSSARAVSFDRPGTSFRRICAAAADRVRETRTAGSDPGLLFDDADDNVLVLLERRGESLDIADLPRVVNHEEDVSVLGPVGEDVVIDLGDDFLLPRWAGAELDVDRQVELDRVKSGA